MDRIDRDEADRKVFVEILIGADVAAAGFEEHLDVELIGVGCQR
jgi:hypothetical protein